MKISDFIIEELNKNGVDKVFGYIGGMITHLVDSINSNKNIGMINAITEQGAGFMAEGYSRCSNKLGVAIATSGPGATNLVTPIANCFFDSTPVLFITGQVNTYEYQQYPIKQCGFQETNIVDIVKPITKYAKMITNADDIKYEIQKAISIANSGRKGPVLLDIPMDIQRTKIDICKLKCYEKTVEINDYKSIKEDLEKSKKPLILIGNGINLSNAQDELKEFLDKTQIPVVQSLLGVDCVLSDYGYNMGLIGTYGNRYGNFALCNCDTLIIMGSRFDIRQSGGDIDCFKNKKIIHIDIDETELNCRKFKKNTINCDAKEFLKKACHEEIAVNISAWHKKCLNLKEMYSDNITKYLPNKILSMLFDELKENDKISTDVGQNQVWTAQSAKIKKGQRLYSSGGHGCMGFALPSAIGATFTGARAIAIAGDGGMQMNIQELEVIKRRNLPVKIIVMNNNNLAMVRAFQELYFDNKFASTVEDYSAPDFEKIAKSYGIKAKTIIAEQLTKKDFEEFLKDDIPMLLNIGLPIKTQVEPRLQFGNSIENMHPLLDEKEIERIIRDD